MKRLFANIKCTVPHRREGETLFSFSLRYISNAEANRKTSVCPRTVTRSVLLRCDLFYMVVIITIMITMHFIYRRLSMTLYTVKLWNAAYWVKVIQYQKSALESDRIRELKEAGLSDWKELKIRMSCGRDFQIWNPKNAGGTGRLTDLRAWEGLQMRITSERYRVAGYKVSWKWEVESWSWYSV